MFRAAEILENRAADYGRMITLEMGKPLRAAIAEVAKCATVCRHYAENAARTDGNTPKADITNFAAFNIYSLDLTTGNVVYDETRLTTVAPKYAGFVEKLYVDFTGQAVRRGQPLLEIYSPELVAALRPARTPGCWAGAGRPAPRARPGRRG